MAYIKSFLYIYFSKISKIMSVGEGYLIQNVEKLNIICDRNKTIKLTNIIILTFCWSKKFFYRFYIHKISNLFKE